MDRVISRPLSIETPTRAEYPEIVRMVNAADARYEEIYTAEEMRLYGVSNMTVRKMQESEGSRRYRVLKAKGKIVAFTSFRTKGSKTLWVSFLFVDPREQRIGYGGYLLTAIEDEARKRGMHTVALATHARALWAISFYLKQGYVLSHELNGELEENQIAFEKRI